MKTRADYSKHALACAILADDSLKKGDLEACEAYTKQVAEAANCLLSALADDDDMRTPGHSVLEMVFPTAAAA